MKKIGIICSPIDENHPSYTVYISNLIKNLNIIDNQNKYYLIHHTNIDLDIYKSNYEIIIPLPRTVNFFSSVRDVFWRYHILPKELKKYDFDLLHDPRGIGLLAYDLPFKKLVTIQSLFSMFYPRYRPGGWLIYKLFRKKVKNADKVITVSESIKQEIIRFLNIPEEKIEVIYNGKDDIFKPLEQEKINQIRKKYSLNFPFILYVGVLQPIKNIPTLIKAYYRFKSKSMMYKLVIAGGKGWQYKDIFNTVKYFNLQKDVIFLGHIPNTELPPLYNAADLFVFPSLYESFGLPILEAMACGTPIICSNRGAIPEIIGDCGIMVDPYGIDEMAEAMFKVLSDGGKKNLMVEEGLKRSRMFSWSESAKRLLKIYNSV